MSAQAMVVDDDGATVELLRMVLELEGYEVVAATATDALERVRTQRPDVVLLDVMMPEKDGLEVLREIRADGQGEYTPVVLVSALSRNVDVWSGWMAGADAYVTKPLDVDMLLKEIDRVRGGSTQVA
ncbi:MAG: response regulator [Nitriliruptorales bacterium]|nr:response regulator [Nitriliruptorales bacterium]